MGLFNQQKPVEVELGPKLFKAIIEVLEDPTGMTAHQNVAYAGRNITQKLIIVGESFYQESILLFKNGWSYGFLVPDQQNEYDKNAVALYLIDNNLMIHKVGHLPREIAAKVSKPIANLLVTKGQVIPVLAQVKGGTKDKSLMGVFASAKTDVIKFD
jgi:hypothetical protein